MKLTAAIATAYGGTRLLGFGDQASLSVALEDHHRRSIDQAADLSPGAPTRNRRRVRTAASLHARATHIR
jgi:hypothetical protein